MTFFDRTERKRYNLSTTSSRLEKLIYPAGQHELSESFLADSRVVSYTDRYSMPTIMPKKRTEFTPLLDTMTIEKTIPDWWQSAIFAIEYPTKFFLQTITAEEFYSGKADEKRVKLFRSCLSDQDKRKFSQSPSIAGMLKDQSTFYDKYNNRGQSCLSYDLVISDNPEHQFFMSHGKGWTSCQHFYHGGYRSQLRATMHDANCITAFIIDHGQSIDEPGRGESQGSILARCHIRLCYPVAMPDLPIYFIDRIYGNDSGLQSALQHGLQEHISEKGMSWATNNGSRFDRPEDAVTLSLITGISSVPSSWDWSYNDNVSMERWNELSYNSQQSFKVGYGSVSAPVAKSLFE